MHKLNRSLPRKRSSFNVLIGAVLLFSAAFLLNGCAPARQTREVTPSEVGKDYSQLKKEAEGEAFIQTGQATLTWDANTEPILGGYQLYYGQASGNYTASVDVGKQTSYTLTGLEEGKTYYFAVKAYDSTRKIWSDFSNEVSHTIGQR